MKNKIFFFITILNISNQIDSGRISKDPYLNNDKNEAKQILDDLRNVMSDLKYVEIPLQAYIVPMNDAHQSEYISDHDKRLQYITKFTGSAGLAIVTENNASLWTDARYHIQAERQIDLDNWQLLKKGLKNVPTTTEWLLINLPNNSKIGVDPFLMPSTEYHKLADDMKKNGHELISVKKNLIDIIWKEQPNLNGNQIETFDIKYSGKQSSGKIYDLREKLREKNADAIVITALDEIAWLLNLRGSDINYNPVFFSYLIITKDEIYFFINSNKLNKSILEHLKDEESSPIIKEYDEILNEIEYILYNKIDGKMIISMDASQAIYEVIPEERKLQISSIVGRMKTIKNDIEANGLQNAHIRDGFALIQYLHWLDITIDKEKITELSGAAKLKEFRSQQENYKGLSFEAISAVGSNAALVHYSPTKETDKEITRDEIYLIDSGGQYWDGTTDITRTVHFGTPTDYEKECFTRVLKGFIALVTSVFPINTSLVYFDYIARRSLWEVGLNYGHGTGHGVGAFLNVHEYPPLISSASGNDPGALENMFTSNEPGYYQEGEFGIRLEDVIQVIKSDIQDAFDGSGALTFRTITLAPIQLKMIDTNLITKEEETYINNYHRMVFNIIGDLLLKRNLTNTYEWLRYETRLIKSTKL